MRQTEVVVLLINFQSCVLLALPLAATRQKIDLA